MSDLTRPPKPYPDNVAALADFAEIECLRRDDRNVSVLDIVRIIQRQHDERNDDVLFQAVNEAFEELHDRVRHCGVADGRYPFVVSNRGSLLEFRGNAADTVLDPSVYIYLLLATRMNMKSERRQGGEDATSLFEQLCCQVAVRFWGGPGRQVGAMVFGTGRLTDERDDTELIDGTSFERRVNELCDGLREGHRFRADEKVKVTARDGKLDIVVWRRFADGRPGQLIGFGQCKTGTNWADDLLKLQPEGFCAKWMLQRPAVLPVRMYFVADRVKSHWYDRCVDGGIVFDRCRIMEYITGLPASLIRRIAKWAKAAASVKGLTLS